MEVDLSIAQMQRGMDVEGFYLLKTAFAKVFQSQGRFAAVITSSVDAAAAPVVLTYRIEPGPQFTLHRVALTPAAGDKDRSQCRLPSRPW